MFLNLFLFLHKIFDVIWRLFLRLAIQISWLVSMWLGRCDQNIQLSPDICSVYSIYQFIYFTLSLLLSLDIINFIAVFNWYCFCCLLVFFIHFVVVVLVLLFIMFYCRFYFPLFIRNLLLILLIYTPFCLILVFNSLCFQFKSLPLLSLLYSTNSWSLSFGAAHRWRWDKKIPLPKICHTYPTMMKVGTVTPPLKKIKKYI